MKKLFPLFILALVILIGCAKEETTPTVADNQQVDESVAYEYVFHQSDDGGSWELTTIDAQEYTTGTTASSRSNSAHAHADYIGIVFNGTENNGGTHGSAYWVVNGPAGLVEMTMETECVMVEGNEAVYGGIVTEIVNPFGPFQEGTHMYFKVIDNGQGNNAPADQFNGIIGFSPVLQCGIWTPSSTKFDSAPDFDMPEPGTCKVNN